MPTPITLPARRSLPSAIYGDDEPVLAGVTVRDVDRAQLPVSVTITGIWAPPSSA